MEFYIDFKNKTFGSSDVLSHFDTLLWMWLLSFVLVRIVDLREKLQQQKMEFELNQMEHEKELNQMNTLKEIMQTIHHEMNNPLAVIYLHAHVLKRKCAQNEDMKSNVIEIELASKRIHAIVVDLSNKLTYTTTHSPVGNLITVNDSIDQLTVAAMVPARNAQHEMVH
jgi:signal transduction histidine kinase